MHNRLSAKLSRERKKAYMHTLESQVQQLEQKKFDYESLIAHLMQENQSLRVRVQHLENELQP